MKKIAIILAGGLGSRFGSEIPKQFIKIDSTTIIETTLSLFQKHKAIDEITLVINSLENFLLKQITKIYPKINHIVLGGKTRGESIINATKALTQEKEAIIIIHDACRPFLSFATIEEGVASLAQKEFCKTVLTPQDDIVTGKKIIHRSKYFILSSPDFMYLSSLRKLADNNLYGLSCAFSAALKHNPNMNVEYIKSDRQNIKITFPEDLIVAQEYLRKARQR